MGRRTTPQRVSASRNLLGVRALEGRDKPHAYDPRERDAAFFDAMPVLGVEIDGRKHDHQPSAA